MTLIPQNPADKIERPKKERFTGSFYDSEEITELFEAAKGDLLELPILFGAFYGLRRSEVIGLKWDAIDFVNDTIIIRHTVTTCNIDGKSVTIAADSTKTKSSMRTLPLVPAFKTRLLEHQQGIEENRRLCGRSYCKQYLDYICVDGMGNLIKPGYVTAAFPTFLKNNGLRKIRYHDLRHSCASLLLANGVPMKQIQEWLGHGGHENTQPTKLLDLRRLNKFSRGAICKEFWNRYLTGKFALMNGHEFRPKNMNQREMQLYRHTMPLKKS